MHSPPKRAGWKAGTIAVAALGGLIRLTGCHSDNTSGTVDMGGNPTGDMAGTTVTPGVPPSTGSSSAIVDRPLAAVVSPDGATAYFTAHDNSAGPTNIYANLYSVPTAGGSPTKIATSKPLYHPLSMAIAHDGNTLYIVDSAGGAIPGIEDVGTVYSSSLSGALSGAAYDGIRGPSSVAVSPDGKALYITGFNKASGLPGVYTVSSSGGTASAVAEGAPFANPSAVTVGTNGVVYVVDATSQGTGFAAVIQVKDGFASKFNQGPLKVGFASGIAPVGPGSTDLLVTGNNGLGSGVVYQLTTAGVATPLTLGSIALYDPATIARAENANIWVVVDTVNATQGAAGSQLGTIFKIGTPG